MDYLTISNNLLCSLGPLWVRNTISSNVHGSSERACLCLRVRVWMATYLSSFGFKKVEMDADCLR